MSASLATTSTRRIARAIAFVSILDTLRSGRLWLLLAGMSLLSWAVLAFPPRLGEASPVFLESLIATQVLASLLFAGLFVAWRTAATEWPWRADSLGPLPLGPVAAVFAMALGHGLVWCFLMSTLVLAQVAGLAVEGSWFAGEGPWAEFLGASLLVGLQGFWLQALARCLGAFLPQSVALIGLAGLLILGPYLGLGAIDPGDPASWARPGLEYFSQAALIDADLAASLRLALLSASGFGFLNVLAGLMLGRRARGLTALDPTPDRK